MLKIASERVIEFLDARRHRQRWSWYHQAGMANDALKREEVNRGPTFNIADRGWVEFEPGLSEQNGEGRRARSIRGRDHHGNRRPRRLAILPPAGRRAEERIVGRDRGDRTHRHEPINPGAGGETDYGCGGTAEEIVEA